MSMKPTLAKTAVVHGDRALHVFRDAIADGVIDADDLRAIGSALGDWHAVARATYVAQALGDALERGIEDEVYTRRLVNAYRAEIDELPATA